MAKLHLLDLPPAALEDFAAEQGQPRYRARQIREWMFRGLEADFRRMSNLPKPWVEALGEKARVSVLRERSLQESADGTRKWALETPDGHVFETVLIPTESRRSLCVSSQIGCAMGCVFCRTASMGFLRNLTLGEILEQVLWANRFLKERDGSHVTNVIFMGMGEPLLNLENVARACEILNDENGFGIGKAHITVSTSGVAPKILEWAERAPDFKLAVSLNGSNDAMRSALMPVNRRWNLEALLAAADEYIRLTGQVLTFEYVLIRGKTCTPEAAAELRRIASHRHCKINLIPLNRGEDPALQPPTEEEILAFEALVRRGGYEVLRRRPRGPDILAACGQLAVSLEKKAA
jgi:23S rRNA (adenine2503-C2)-methyltransferase